MSFFIRMFALLKIYNMSDITVEMKKSQYGLIQEYMRGFSDELGNLAGKASKPDTLFKRAYNLGRLDAIVGDDIKSVDHQSYEQILNKIKGI